MAMIGKHRSHPQWNGRLTELCCGNSIFIAYGQGIIVTSPDGETWTKETAGLTNSVSFGDGFFMATTKDGNVLFSFDGITWTQKYTW